MIRLNDDDDDDEDQDDEDVAELLARSNEDEDEEIIDRYSYFCIIGQYYVLCNLLKK